MITLIRKNQKWLLVIVSVFVIIAFAWLYNDTRIDQLGSDKVLSIYDRSVTNTEIQRRARLFDLTISLGLFDYITALAGPIDSREQARENFVMNSFVLEREANDLLLAPNTRQIAEMLRSLPTFQTDGVYDPIKYAQFSEERLTPFGFTQVQLEEVLGNALKVQTIQNMLNGGVAISEAEVRGQFELGNRTINSEAVMLPLAEVVATIEVSEEDVAEYFESRGATLTTDEKRSVQYVTFALPESAAELEGPERIKVLQETANDSAEFAEVLLQGESDFAEAAAKSELEVKETPLFTAAEVDPSISTIPNAAGVVFNLTEELSTSDPVQTTDGFVVFHLKEVEASRPLTLEEARERIVESIRETRAFEQLASRAETLRTELLAEMQTGKSFADSVRSKGLEPQVYEGFSMSNPNMEIPEWPTVARAAMELRPGDLSNPVQTMEGKLLLYITNWQPADDEAFLAQSETMRGQMLNEKQSLLFYQWITDRSEAANIQPL